LSIGPVAIRYYGLAYAIGFLLVYAALRRSSLSEHADDLTLRVMLGVILGGRIGEFVFYRPAALLSDPLSVLRIWEGGMSFHGGLIGCAIALAWYAHSRKLSLLRIADIIVIPASIALVLGRVANFLNGELIGTVTSVPWCVIVEGWTGCRHPSPLYEAGYSLVIALVLAALWWRAKRTQTPLVNGKLFGVFLVLYGVFRFTLNFFRDDIRYLGISTGQYLSLLTALVGVWLLWKLSQRAAEERQAPAATNTHKYDKKKKRKGRSR
jgi:phosphatidylglycerol:prolipoprotein diacylglycerol transferase